MTPDVKERLELVTELLAAVDSWRREEHDATLKAATETKLAVFATHAAKLSPKPKGARNV